MLHGQAMVNKNVIPGNGLEKIISWEQQVAISNEVLPRLQLEELIFLISLD